MIESSRIIYNTPIAQDIFEMELTCSFSKACSMGQFLEIQVPGYYLRRPISISEIKEDSLKIIYKVVGSGTEKLSRMEPGSILNIFGPLGHGFPQLELDRLTLIGGGVGVPPLYEAAKQYPQASIDVILGFNSAQDVFYEEAFQKLGCNVIIATMDGSMGVKGTVLDAIREKGIEPGCIFACGPLPMLKAIQKVYDYGYLSLEARMACGMGACMGCVVKDKDGHSLRVCKDGPVFEIKKVVL